MEKQVYKTLLNNEHKFADNNYVIGRIFGIAEIICDLYGGTKQYVDEEGNVHDVMLYRGGWIDNTKKGIMHLQTECTAEQYEKFKAYVENWYPDLLTFYWDGNK